MGNLIFNDASLPFSCAMECSQKLNSFFQILFSIKDSKITITRADELEGEWNSYIYAEGFEFGQWINQIEDRDQKRIIKTVIANIRCPLRIESPKVADDILFSLVADPDIEVKALGVASILNEPVLSVGSHEYWTQSSIAIVQEWDDSGIVQQTLVDVPNVSSQLEVDKLKLQIKGKSQQNQSYLESLTTHHNQDYPNLIFCESVLKSLASTGIIANNFSKIISVLNELNQHIKASYNLQDLIDKTGLDISGESLETMSCAKHARKRKFKHPDLGQKVFEIHIKNFNNARRMHILPDFSENIVAIGYFGAHLSTVNFPS